MITIDEESFTLVIKKKTVISKKLLRFWYESLEDTAGHISQKEDVSDIVFDKKPEQETTIPEQIIDERTQIKYETKECSRCGQLKFIQDFNKNQYICRECQHKDYMKNKKKEIHTELNPVESTKENMLTKKVMESSDGGEWDTVEEDFMRENYHKLTKETLMLKLSNRTQQEIDRKARYMGLIL